VRFLLDTHIVLAIVGEKVPKVPPFMLEALSSRDADLCVSVASLWEVAIKNRLGKLPLPCPLSEWPDLVRVAGIRSLQLATAHVIQPFDPWPETTDPFDRILLQVCAAERRVLVTWDSKLINHPLAWRP
jgi:PIN domain nuclease of toxin-antitoxin system